MDIKRYLKEKKKIVDDCLKQYSRSMKDNPDCPPRLSDAMQYALMAGGKRLRPILAIASHEAAGGRSSKIIPIASSIELIHTYSLIHDDLPAMDDDDFRRNKPTTHRVYGEGLAILAGDALLTDAFYMLSATGVRPERLMKIVRELSYAAGPSGMVGGQVADLEYEGKKADPDVINYIHTHKTGALIRASVRIGGILAAAPQSKMKALTEYAEKVGLAFQIMDDILDITGTKEELGKSTGADIARGKNTYPSVFGLERSYDEARRLINESINAVKIFNRRAEPLMEIARYITERRN
jgi:geranylgeranyl diphosphate synthase type II